MSDFYLLPPRPSIGEDLARVVRPYLPGLRITGADCLRFLEELIERNSDRAFLVHREDLPDADDVCDSLRDGFGAEEGDRVLQVSVGPRAGEPRLRMSLIGESVMASH